MAKLTRPIDDRGAVVRLRVGLTRLEAMFRRDTSRALVGPFEIAAMIDTGANVSAIEPDVVQSLELSPVDHFPMPTPSGTAPQLFPIYQAELSVEENGSWNSLGTVEVVGCESLSANGYLMRLGRDVLDRVDFTYDGPSGTFTLDF